MTLKELYQLYDLKREIELDRRRILELRRLASTASPALLTGMPRHHESHSKIEKYLADISEIEEIIREKQARCLEEQKHLERYIAEIDDSLTRQIFTLRFIECMDWDDCAAKIGYTNTWKNLSNICYRYIDKTGRKQS